MRPEWLADEDPRTLAGRVEHVFRRLQATTGSKCPGCESAVCGHMVLLSLAAGFEDVPRCLNCLAQEIGRDADRVRDQLTAFVLSKECLVHGWRLANMRESVDDSAPPRCMWSASDSLPDAEPTAAETPESTSEEPVAAATWDAGELGCGDLVLELRRRMESMDTGTILKLTARDPGAHEDLPAWCRLTGHGLVHAKPPDYWIQRKE